MPQSERRPLISGNWKMHHNHLEAIQVVQKLSYRLTSEDYEAVDVSVHPAFTALRSIQLLIEDQRIPVALGAQNCHWEQKGAFTGEVSVAMLAKLDVVYVIVGHSERRELFHETDEDVRRKLEAVIAGGMTPIVCVGETLDEREAGGADAKVTGQVEAALTGLPEEQISGLVIAYEPIWAIGTGRTAGGAVRIQYGGSVKPANAVELLGQPDVDGALVGGASLDADEFTSLVRYRTHPAA